ncbi:MAG TPA: glycine zipper family protein [Burkholderiales bacterium]|jgi:hypothetical protein|nr:glycine zipper family protein [Burkholderiales bacterium]
MSPTLTVSAIAAAVLLSACATVPPSGPSVMVLPGTAKSFDQFRADDYECRQFASSQIGGTSAEQASTDSGVKSAAVGTAVGAVAGALVGGRRGAAVGAGTGLLVGSAAGAGTADVSARTLQQRYDIGYQQCMYAKGHRVPVAGRFDQSRHPSASYSTPPPPPPGTPPPPPPR